MNKKINILFISHSPHQGGAETSLYLLLKYINIKKFRPVVVFHEKKGRLYHKVRALGLTIYIVKFRWWISPSVVKSNMFEYVYKDICKRIKKLKYIVEKENIDIIYTNTSVVADGAFVANILHIPHIWHLHEYLDEKNSDLNLQFGTKRIINIIYKLSSTVILPSKFLYYLLKKNLQESKKLKVIYNGIEDRDIKNNFNKSKIIHFFEEAKRKRWKLIGNIGVITELKNQFYIVKSLCDMLKRDNKTHILLIGKILDVDYYNKICNYIADKEIESQVHFLGFVDDIYTILKYIDVLIVSSRFEIFPYTVLEALYNKVAVIATNVGGIKEIIKDKETGLLLNDFSVNTLSESVRKVLFNKTFKDKIVKNGYKVVVKNFLIKKIVKSIEDTILLSINKYRYTENLSIILMEILEESIKVFNEYESKIAQVENELYLIKNSRWWKLRELMTTFIGLLKK